jgi:hypothetical protein
MRCIKILTGLVILILFSCQKNDEKLISEFYDGLNNSDFSKIQRVIADTLIVADGDWIEKYSKNDYYNWFAWDSVFEPSYLIKNFEKTDSGIFFTVSKQCKRIDFLHGGNLDFNVRATINDNKLSGIYAESYVNMDFAKWGQKRDTLINWVDREQPDLSGFMNIQNSEYAEKYLKVINMYSDFTKEK